MSEPTKKSATKRLTKAKPAQAQTAKPAQAQTAKPTQSTAAHASSGKRAEAASKQTRVIAMLQSRGGATIAAVMQETGWQQHSVRGFLAGVVRKKLKLKLGSAKVDGARVYRIGGADQAHTGAPRPKRRSA